MIIKTKNSTYEICDKLVRNVFGKDNDCIGKDFVKYDLLFSEPEIGKSLVIMLGDTVIRTSVVIAIN